MIRLAHAHDLESILSIYESARSYMSANGNPTQWGTSYPEQSLLLSDILADMLYVCADAAHIYGVFMLMEGEEPSYRYIQNGSWKNELPYGTIHRVAGDGRTGGVFAECTAFCKKHCSNLRIDTHPSNLTMQHLIEKNGFEKCGIIYVEDGTPRIAYQWVSSV